MAGVASVPPPAAAQSKELWSHWQLYTVVRSLAVDKNSLWVGTDHGLMRFYPKSQEKVIYGTAEGLLSTVVLFVKVGPDGTPWVGTAGGGLSQLQGNRWVSYTPYGYGSSLTYGASWTSWPKGQGIGDLWVYNVAFDRDGVMWAATWKGLSRFNGRGFETFTVDDGLIDQWIYTLAIDSQGRIWCGTEGGMSRYDPRPGTARVAQWKSWTNADGVGAPIDTVMAEVGAGLKPAPAEYTGSNHHAAGGPKDISKPVNPNYISSSLFDQDGRLWVGTLGGGLSRYDGRRWTSYTTKQGLSGNVVYALAADQQGRLWIGTDGGVSRFDFQTFTNFRKEDGLFAGAVYAVAVDGSGAKWFGSYGQLSRYEGD
ncbi:MAG: two-component regulator propeller domain-containing protein [Nitrospirota bacterium]